MPCISLDFVHEHLSLLHVNNKGADQPAHLGCLISTFILAHWIRISDILSRDRNSYLIHVILPRLSNEGCTLIVLELTHMEVEQRHFYLVIFIIASQGIQGLLEAYFKIKCQW